MSPFLRNTGDSLPIVRHVGASTSAFDAEAPLLILENAVKLNVANAD